MGLTSLHDTRDAPIVMAGDARGTRTRRFQGQMFTQRHRGALFRPSRTFGGVFPTYFVHGVYPSISDQKEVAPFRVPLLSPYGRMGRGCSSRQEIYYKYRSRLGLAGVDPGGLGFGTSPRCLGTYENPFPQQIAALLERGQASLFTNVIA